MYTPVNPRSGEGDGTARRKSRDHHRSVEGHRARPESDVRARKSRRRLCGAGRRGRPYRSGYCSAKAGQVGMTYGMALELGPRGIRVNCVAPGAVAGDRIDRVIAGQAQVRGVSEEAMRKAMMERSPLKRMTEAEDIAEATLFFASDLAKNISGQVLAVNAGEPAG